MGLAALGPGQCQLPPWAPEAFQASELYKPWLRQRKDQLWPEEQGLKDLFPSPNSSTQARALSCTVSFKDACSPTVAPSIKSNSKPFIGFARPRPPHDSLSCTVSSFFTVHTFPPQGLRHAVPSAWNILSQDRHRLIFLILSRSLLKCQPLREAFPVHRAPPWFSCNFTSYTFPPRIFPHQT